MKPNEYASLEYIPEATAAPGENIRLGEVCRYAPDWRAEGEEKYIHVVIEERGDDVLIRTINTKLTLMPTQQVKRYMLVSCGINVKEA